MFTVRTTTTSTTTIQTRTRSSSLFGRRQSKEQRHYCDGRNGRGIETTIYTTSPSSSPSSSSSTTRTTKLDCRDGTPSTSLLTNTTNPKTMKKTFFVSTALALSMTMIAPSTNDFLNFTDMFTTREAYAADEEVGKCTKTCVKACLDLAPKSGEYCQETCADECEAMKKDGDTGDTNFSMPPPDEGLQGNINKVLDKGAIFFVR